jgi:hypothetical protein
MEQIPQRYVILHILAEVSSLIDMKGPELTIARSVLHRLIALMQELPLRSVDACASIHYSRLGLTDAAIGLAAKEQGCSVLTNDLNLYLALLEQDASVVRFDYLRDLL